MKQFSYSLLFLVVFISCQQQVSSDSIAKINGYWEIHKVEFADGKQKEYTVNETVDYFEWNQSKGFRKKVKPQFDGTFLTNNEAEEIHISDSSGSYMIQYKTAYTQWNEEIITLTDSVLVLKNKQNLEYHYKRFTPFSLK
jgi:hypothetical protein